MMPPLAIDRCRLALDHSTKHLEVLEDCRDFETFRFAWVDFLNAHQRFFSMLAHWAKGCPKRGAWFKGIKKTRTADPLFCYLHQARHSQEHSIEDLHGKSGPSVILRLEGPMRLVPEGLQTLGPIKQSQEWLPPRPSLLPATNRGKSYLPPERHLGEVLTDTTPQNVARLGTQYAENTLSEAIRLDPGC